MRLACLPRSCSDRACAPVATHCAARGVLPDDRADVLYHRYDGGGVTIHGPSVLVRKKMAEKYSVSANYYMDMVTSASIDVEVSGASEYKEERNQYSLGFDYLRGKTTYSLNYTNSDEDDYQAETASFGISQDLFGDLTTISMGFAQGADIVRKRDTITDQVDPNFKEPVDRWSYRVGVSQILTKSLIMALNLEVITDEGYLNNPYRSFRYVESERRPPVRARHRNLSAHAHQQRRRPERALLPAVSRRGVRRLSLLHRYVGHRRRHVRARLHASARPAGCSRPASATTRRTTPTSTPTCSSAGTSRTSWRATRSCRRSTARRCACGASYEFARTGWSFVKKGSVNCHLRPHGVRLRRFPRRALFAAAGRRSELPAGRQRAAVQVRRERLPGVRLDLVLTNR